MSLAQISAQLGLHSKMQDGAMQKKMPPVELWDPPYCGEIDIEIKGDGSWFYNGSAFKRLSLVKLFASVLKKEGDEHFLVTPVEKVKISVADAPFVLTQWQWQDEGANTRMLVSTNLGDEFLLDADHPLTITPKGNLYICVRRNLMARVHRNVYYQWVALAQEKTTDEQGTQLVFNSAGHEFILGCID